MIRSFYISTITMMIVIIIINLYCNLYFIKLVITGYKEKSKSSQSKSISTIKQEGIILRAHEREKEFTRLCVLENVMLRYFCSWEGL